MKLQPRTRSNRRASSASFKSELNKLVENAKMGLIEQKFDTIASMVSTLTHSIVSLFERMSAIQQNLPKRLGAELKATKVQQGN